MMSNQRQQVAESLQKQRETFFTIFQKAPYGVALVDKDGTYLYINPEFTSLTGYTLEDIPTGREWFHKAYPDPEYRRRVIATWKEDIAQKGTGRVFSVACKNGETREIGFRSTLLDDGSTFIMLSDITERRRMEEELRESEEKLEAMLQSIGDHMSMMDRDLNIIWANETARKVFGNDVTGKKCYEVYHKRKEPCEPYPCLALKTFRDGKVHAHDTQVIDKDGKTIHFHCTSSVALRDKEGKPAAVIEVSRDITEHKQTEEKLQEFYRQEREARLKLQEEAEEKLQFINTLAHELKTPLTSIVASGGLLLEELEGKVQSSWVRLVENMLHATNKLENRLTELLDMAKMGGMSFNLELELLDARLLLQNVTRELSPVAAKKGLSLTLDLPPSVPMVNADWQRLEQVMFNLVTNALYSN